MGAMRRIPCLLLVGGFVASAFGAKQQQPAPLIPCPVGASAAACNPSRQDEKTARAAFARGLKLQQKNPDDAYEEFDRAAHLVPRNGEYITAREVSRQQLITRDIE